MTFCLNQIFCSIQQHKTQNMFPFHIIICHFSYAIFNIYYMFISRQCSLNNKLIQNKLKVNRNKTIIIYLFNPELFPLTKHAHTSNLQICNIICTYINKKYFVHLSVCVLTMAGEIKHI